MIFEFTLALVVALAFFLQRIAGFGSAVIATPVLALMCDPHESIALMLIYQAVFGLWLIGKVWRRLLDRKLLSFQIFFLPAVLLGSYILPQIPADTVRKGLAAVCALVLIQWLFLSRLRLPRRWQPAAGSVGGLASGLLQGAFGMGGPLFLLYLGCVEERAERIRDSTIAVFTIANLLRAPVALATVQFTPGVLQSAAFTAPFFVVVMILGARLSDRVRAERFRYLVVGILLLAAMQLTLS